LTVEELTEIYADVLETAGVGPDTDFFDYGGDSLLATRVLSAVARRYGAELTFEDFLQAPTPAGLATRIRSLLTAGARP